MSAKIRARSGSALLVVLGMMSFMLFSGMAFAVYMRYARLSTSFLRRTTTTRQLAKAALAEAIEQIDTAIANNPHPGVNPNGYTSGSISNVWHHRVFFGTGSNVDESKMTASERTPSVLTLEGLAYLPPNLINDVRYYARVTPTAKWNSFWFDSGRYAYVAVDVSDYFDVNRLQADLPRAASADQHITLAHLFEKIEDKGDEGLAHTGAGSGADKWDQFVATAGENDPFVSLADFNIAWNGNGALTFGSTKVENPFKEFVETGHAYGENMTAEDPKSEYYRQLTFVTDSWSPTPKRTDGITVADLEDSKYQPFKQSDLTSKSVKSAGEVAECQTTLLTQKNYLGERLSFFTRLALWDYLDEDSQPVSLAVPTCERVPMICAIHPEFSGVFKIERTFDASADRVVGTVTEGKTTYELVERDVTYKMKFEGVGQDLSGFVGWTYPFLLRGEKEEERFTLDGRVAVFLTDTDGISARPGKEIEGLYWSESEKSAAKASVSELAAVYAFNGQGASKIDPKTITSSGGDSDKIPTQDIMFKAENEHTTVTKPLVTVTFKWKRNAKTKQPENPQYIATEIPDASRIKSPEGNDVFGAMKKDGTCDTDYSFLKNGTSKKLKVNVALWARVKNRDDKTVDLVPACLMDDEGLNGVNNVDMGMMFGDTEPYPLLSLDAGEIEFSLEKFNSGKDMPYSLTGKALMTGDPRYNHAPENWQIVTDPGTSLSKKWYEREREYFKDRDGDIYMAVSDQGYLQSIYELMMLPRIQNGLTKSGVGGMYMGQYSTSFDGQIRSESQALKDRTLMWRTYNPDDFSEIGDGRIVSGDGGPKVNPYTSSTNVLMAAFANTPRDWRVASTNNDDVADMTADKFNADYAWNAYGNEETRLCWGCLSDIAGVFSEEARKSGDWETAWRDLEWNMKDSDKMIEDVELDDEDSDIYAVDKKFFYGFWHDSFAARQQLFLIFVRSEPMMMGGGVAGQAPPQLGARAVALVWREPSAFADSAKTYRSGTTTSVHRTRVLFYHQFD